MKKTLLTLTLVLSMLLLTACSKEVQEKRERVIEGTSGVTQKEPSALEKNYRPTSGLDYRQVLFGNTYENIIEVDTDDFFAENTEVKKEADFYRVYEQKIGSETFYRVLVMDKNYSDTMLLDWKNVSFTQDLYVVENNDLRLLIENMGFYEKMDDRYVSRTHGGIEIIERHDTVIGVMQFYNGNFTGGRTTLYYRWEDIRVGNGIVYTLYSVENYGVDGESETEALVDDRRPLMYTIQNAFDGDPATSFVNYGEAILIDKAKVNKDGYVERPNRVTEYFVLPQLQEVMMINGYASGEYYYQNNQIAEMSITGVLSYYSFEEGFIWQEEKQGYLYLEDSLKPQVMQLQNEKKDFNRIDVLIEKIVSGTKYNDTALAEIDFYLEGMGWLFGFADEENAVDLSTVNTIDGLRYEFNDNTATVITYNGSDTEVTIPSEVVHNGKTYTVTAIGDKVFQNRDTLSTVVIPNGITSIGKYTFEGCKSLKELQLPETVLSIGEGAFMNSGLENVNIPKKVSIIDAGVFYGTNITTIDIPETVTGIGNNAFQYCRYLTNVIIPEATTYIAADAFLGCTSLTSIRIPASVEYILAGAFACCDNLTEMTFIPTDNVISDIFSTGTRSCYNDKLVFYGYKDSTAYEIARNYAIPFFYIN